MARLAPAPYTAVFAATVIAACIASLYDSYSNACGPVGVAAVLEAQYIEPYVALHVLRGPLALTGLILSPVCAAFAKGRRKWARLVYLPFVLVWVATYISWESPCPDHKLEAATYASLVAAALCVATQSTAVYPPRSPKSSAVPYM